MNNLKLKLSMLLCLLALGLGSVSAQANWSRMAVKGRTAVSTPIMTPSQFTSAVHPTSGAWFRDYVSYRLSHHTFGNNQLVYFGETAVHKSGAGYINGFAGLTCSAKADSYTKVTYSFKFNYGLYNGAGYGIWGVKSEFLYYGSVNPMNYSLQGNCRTRSGGSNGVQTLAFLNKHNGKSTPDYPLTFGTSQMVYHSITVDNSNGANAKTDTHYYGVHACNGWAGESMFDTSLRLESADPTYLYYKHVTFNANGGTGTMAQQKIETKGNLTANAFTREGFTFAGWNTKADGTGTQYAAGAEITATAADKGLVTLYAQWTAEPITATFDYTYRTSDAIEETYVHMSDEAHEGAAITNKVLAILKDHNGAALKSVVLTAGNATTPTGEITSVIATHKTASLTLKVVKGDNEGVATEGSNYTVTLSATNYSNYRSVDFEVLTNGSTQVSQTKAPHWEPLKHNATDYLFKYEGHSSTNMFDLTWTVSLKNLSMYPSHIFVKPMRKGTHSDNGGNINLEQIPAMEGMDGEVCELAGYIKAPYDSITIAAYNALEDKSTITIAGAYYKGEYRVLKTCSHGNAYNYQLGLTGFTIDGNTYYLSAQHGDIPSDMVSTAVATSENVNINFDRAKEDIPVLILQPGTGATVNGQSGYLLYVDNDANVDTEGKRTVNLEQFEAVRPNYTFVGWKDVYDDTHYEANGIYTFKMGTKATTTLLAQWVRTNAPIVEEEEFVESNGNFIYKVKAEDELGDVQSVQYAYTNSDEEQPAANVVWTDMTADTENSGFYTHSIPTLNSDYGKYLWVKASNADKSSIICLGEIRSIFKVTANPNPDKTTTIVTPNGTWSEPTEENPIPVFTPDPNGSTTTTTYYDHYSTFYFGNRSFKVYDATVYTANLVDGSKLELKKIEPAEENAPVVIPQNTAVILRKVQTEVNDNIIELEECEQAEYNGEPNCLEGTDDIASHQTGKKYYIFSYAQHGLGFYLNSKTSLAAHKAYICLPEESKIRAFTLNFGEDDPITVAIHEIETTGKTSMTYDLSGRKVNDGGTHGGIYLKSGSKLLKK